MSWSNNKEVLLRTKSYIDTILKKEKRKRKNQF